jgi:GNAT superfamily N-acetyltransferase
MTTDVGVRSRKAGDEAAIVEIYARQEPDGEPLPAERYRVERSEDGSEGWVATAGAQVVGFADLSPAWWTARPDIYALDLRVDVPTRGQGIGTLLLGEVLSRLDELRAVRVAGWVREDAVEGRRFAARHGFRETGEIDQDFRLHVPEARADAYPGVQERLQREGLHILSLAEIGMDDEFLAGLHALWADWGDAPPDPERLRRSHASWREHVLLAPALSPETHWVALDGRRPVGMTFLKRLDADAAENDYTGVASTYRGRGIAPALKLHAIAWAQEHGVRWFYTSSEVGNGRMIAINTRLGYRPGARRLEIARDLT